MTAIDAVPQDQTEPDVTGHPHRWAVLAVVCLAVFVTVLDGTIVNVALPSLAIELGASTRQLQWIVDAYLLVFTGLLLAAGGLGDKFGRKRMLMAGLLVFGATSAYAGSVDSSGALKGFGTKSSMPSSKARRRSASWLRLDNTMILKRPPTPASRS